MTHRRLRALLLDPSRRTNGSARSYLLSGFLVCWQCEKAADVEGGAATGTFEKMMTGALFERLDSPELARAVADAGVRDDSGDLVAAIAGDEARLEHLARDHYVDEIIGRAHFLTASRQLEGRIEATRRRLTARQATTAASPWLGRGDVLAATWEDMTFDRKRAVVLALVESVTIGPAVRGLGRFDPSRVGTPNWRS